jgi:hypothetical protein
MKSHNSTIDMKGIESEFMKWFGMSSQSSCRYDDYILDSMKEENLLIDSCYEIGSWLKDRKCFHKNLF